MTNSIDLEDQTSLISNREEFVKFLEALFNDYITFKDEWENITVESFLNGLIGFAESADGYYKNFNIDIDAEKPSWRLFADMLLAARVYE